jgi:hypothetical protein
MPSRETEASRAPFHIPGWPVVLPGLLMMTLDGIVFMHLDERMTDVTYATYFRELEASLTNRHMNSRVAVIYDMPTFSSLRAMGAREGAAILKRHDEKVRQTTACIAVVTQSALARAAVQTVLAVSGLSFPHRAFSGLGPALAFAAMHVSGVDPSVAERAITDTLVAQRVQAMR